MQEKSESSESSEQAKKINLKELRAQILSMSKQDAMDYILGDEWYKTPRPFQIAILKRSGWNWMESYIATSIENLGRSDNPFYESSESIGELMGVSPRTVRKAGSRLKARGILNREGKNGERHREWKWMDSDNSDGKSETRLETNAMISVIDPGTNVTSTQELLSRLPRNYCHVDPGTNVTPHNNRKDLKKKEKNKKEDRKGEKPPAYLTKDSSFKKRSDTEIQTMLDSFPWEDYLVDAPNGLAGCFTDIIGIWKSPSEAKVGRDEGSANIIDPMDEKRAFMTLKQMGDLKTRDRICKWLKWYIQNRGLEKSLYITDFSASWKKYHECETAQKKAQYEKEREEKHMKWVKESILEINKCPQIKKVMEAVGELLDPETMENLLPELADLAQALLADPPCIVTDPEVTGLIADIKERDDKYAFSAISRFGDMVEKRREAMMTGVATD